MRSRATRYSASKSTDPSPLFLAPFLPARNNHYPRRIANIPRLPRPPSAGQSYRPDAGGKSSHTFSGILQNFLNIPDILTDSRMKDKHLFP